MSTERFYWCLLSHLALAFIIHSTDAVPILTLQPTNITDGITEQFDLNCSFTVKNNINMSALISLHVSKSSDGGETFEELASITELKPDYVNVLTSENIEAEGFVRQEAESYIHLTWKYPSAKQDGWYRCCAEGIDYTGHCSTDVDSAHVKVYEANLMDLIDMVQDLKSNTETLEKTVSQLNAYAKDLEEKIEENDNYTSNLHRTVSEIRNQTDSLEQQISEINVRVRPEWKCHMSKTFIQIPVTYQDSKYYLREHGTYSIQAAIDECQLCGGDLMMINNQQEFYVIQGYLNTTGGFKQYRVLDTKVSTGFKYIAIAGSDALNEGTWINESTNQTLPYLNWGPTDPNGGTAQNCLALYHPSPYFWMMADFSCPTGSFRSDVRYICEVTST